MTKLAFSKMHGLGNDFVVLDGIRQNFDLSTIHIRQLADRRFGIGCDQVLVVETSTQPSADFRYRIFNADGSEVQQCGNGARCFARFVRDQGLTDKDRIKVETQAGIIEPQLEANGQVTVNMGQPRFDPADLPFQAKMQASVYALDVAGETHALGAVSMGNPHAVLCVDDLDQAPVATLGAAIESHPRFPERVNVGFCQIVDSTHIRLRVFERGVGETLACGTGACAAMVIGRNWDKLSDCVTVSLPGGDLSITWSGKADDVVWMTGPVAYVFEGTIEL